MKKTQYLLIIMILSIGSNSFSQARPKTEPLKIIAYNIWNGFDWGKDSLRREKLADWVAQQKPDIVGLQELCAYTDAKLAQDAKQWGHDYSVLLKESGYSVGLTSNNPIEIIERIFDGMHHGALHCKSNDIDIFVIHFSPSSYKKRREEAEIILDKIATVAKSNPNYVVMGDFNAHSPFDADLYKNGILLNRLQKSNADKPETGNLVDKELDYAVLSNFLAHSLIDVCQKYTVGIKQRGSFPARSLSKPNETHEQLETRLERIDFMMVSPELGKNCVNAKVYNGEDNWYLSDHYPVMAEFVIP